MKAKEMREKSKEDLLALSRELDREIFVLRNELRVTRKLEKPHLLREKRKDKARLLTIVTELEKEGK